MTRFTAAATAVVGAICLLSACQADPAPTPKVSRPPTPAVVSPSPTPSPTCTPEAGGAGYPCTRAQYDEMKQKDALYAEAEAVFQKYWAENIRLSRTGGTKEPTAALLEIAGDSVLENMMDIYGLLVDQGLRAIGDDPDVTVSRVPDVSKQGSVVTLLTCVDASHWSFYHGDKLVSTGRPAEDRLFFGRVGAGLKIIFVDGRWVDSCD
jgi:hypothetical protein